MIKSLLGVFLVLCTPCAAIEYQPWFGMTYGFDASTEVYVWGFSKIAGQHRDLPYATTNERVTGRLGFMPGERWYLQVQGAGVHTRAQHFNVEAGEADCSYQLWDDISGQNALSLTVGVTLLFPFNRSLHDPSLIHHWFSEGFLHASLGKEWQLGCLQFFRFWGMAGFGAGTHGPGFFSGLFRLEGLFCRDRLFVGICCNQGFGGQRITTLHNFPGYTKIGYRVIDLEIGWSYTFETVGQLEVKYLRTVHSKNAPKEVNAGLVRFTLPFGL